MIEPMTPSGWAGQQEASGRISCRASADVTQDVGVHIDELDRVVSILLDLQHFDEQFGPKIRPHESEWHVRADSLNGLVVGEIELENVLQRVPACLVSGLLSSTK
jgi:hypothetical protein